MTIRTTRLRATTTLLAALALIAGLAGPAAATPSAPARPDRPGAPAQPVDCEGDQSGTHIGAECDRPGGTNPDDGDDPGGPGGTGGGGIDAAAECAALYPGWADCVAVVNANGMHPDDICGYVVAPDQSLLDYYHPDRPEGYDTLLYNICPREGLFYSEDTQAAQGGGPPPPPDPEDVAEDLWVAVQADLASPALETWPPQNMSSVLRLPSFVAVTNWPDGGVVEDDDCDGPTCVALQATPDLAYDPGDGTGEIACEPGGTTFDRYGAEPEDQAGGDACAHAFPRRTGVGSRPEAWPGVVSITWTAEWQEVLPGGGIGETGDFDPVVLSTELPRVVTEFLSFVTDVTPSGGR